jgi:membrane associated rhomboid family serine protease
MNIIPNLVPVAILAVTMVVSVIAFRNPALMQKWILSPYRMTRSSWYTSFITSGFIHADIGHLFFNMFTFYFFAFPLNEIMGSMKFSILYFASMIIADLPSFVKNRNNPSYASLGASGAVSGVVFGFILYEPLSRIYIMFIPVGIPAFVYAALYLVYCVYAARRQGDHINHSAHFWGSLAGVVITVIFDPGVFGGFINKILQFIA